MARPFVFIERFRDPPARRRRNRLEAALAVAGLTLIFLAAIGAAVERMS